jgi:tetratricopeptide (TPR) repeat protein
MAKKKEKYVPSKINERTLVPEGVKVARTRDFANEFNINSSRYSYEKDKNPHFAMFFGAGTSKDSGIKLAFEMIEDFKEIILKDEGLSDASKEEKSAWFDKQDWYLNTPNKYSCLFQKAYRTDIARRNYIEDLISKGEASFGYIILANFIAENYVDTIITTNFDDLIYQACTTYTDVRPVVYSLGGFASEMISQLNRPKVLKIHGDFLFSELKNTETELAEQDPNMSKQVEQILQKYDGLIVIGYAGNDESVMNLLEKLPKGRALYWCERPRMLDSKQTIFLNDRVIKLLNDKDGHLIEINGFDRFIKEIKELTDFDEDIIVNAFAKRQNKLNEELRKFDKEAIDSTEKESATTEKKEESFGEKIEGVFDFITLKNKANEAWENKKYDVQEKFAKQMIKDKPNDENGYFYLALALQELNKDLDKAEKYYRKVITLEPNYEAAYNNLGNLLANDESRLNEAESAYNKAIEINPNYAEAYSNLGLMLSKDESRWIEAESAYRKAIEINPNYSRAYFNFACLRSLSRKEENKDEAFEFLRKAIELDSKFKEMAKTDPDFDFIRNDPRFKEIVGDDD